MNDYAPQMIVKTPSPWHVLATQNSTAQTPSVCFHARVTRFDASEHRGKIDLKVVMLLCADQSLLVVSFEARGLSFGRRIYCFRHSALRKHSIPSRHMFFYNKKQFHGSI